MEAGVWNDMKRKITLKKILYEILDWSKVLLTAFAITFVVSKTLIANAQVPTGSMETTIMTGSRVLINRLAYMQISAHIMCRKNPIL